MTTISETVHFASPINTAEVIVEPIVYVVDDDRLMRETLSGLFRSVGWRVRLFESAQECWPIWFLWQKISGSVAGSDSENRQRAPKKIRVT